MTTAEMIAEFQAQDPEGTAEVVIYIKSQDYNPMVLRSEDDGRVYLMEV